MTTVDVPRTLEQTCDPARMALLVYDMQVGVLNQIADAERVIAAVVETVEAAREGGFRVVYLRHMGIPTQVSGSARLRTAMAWQRVDRVEDVRPAFLRATPASRSR